MSNNTCRHCKEKLGAASSDGHCHKCMTRCTTCNIKLCTKHDLYERWCDIGTKSGQAIQCASCNNFSCGKHIQLCYDCSQYVCDKCKFTHAVKCTMCDEWVCSENGIVCEKCNKFRCFDGGCAYGDCSCNK